VTNPLTGLLERLGRRNGAAPERVVYIQGYSFPPLLRQKIRDAYPHLTDSEVAHVLDGLRQWFLVCLHARGRTVGMPSEAVDEAWHEFILITRAYTEFCDNAFGRYLHHTPAAAMDEGMAASLARTVRVLDTLPATMVPVAVVPLLFAVDTELGIPYGHAYDAEHIRWLRDGGWKGSSEGSTGGYAGDGGCIGGDGSGGGDGGGGCGGGGCGGS
jgi:hypothetical protein